MGWRVVCKVPFSFLVTNGYYLPEVIWQDFQREKELGEVMEPGKRTPEFWWVLNYL